MNDITKTGPLSYLLLQQENALKQNLKIEKFNKKMSERTSEEQRVNKLANLFTQAANVYAPQTDLTSPQAIQERSAPELGTFGESKFDDTSLQGYGLSQWDNIRARNLSGLSKAASGLAKMGILAGTTFVSGTVGLLAGLVPGSSIWDNSVTRAMQDINDKSEEWLPNYADYEELYGAWTSNIFTWNTIFDKIIKNAGFIIGAAGAGGVYTKAIAALAKTVKAAKWLKGMSAGLEHTQEAAVYGEKAMLQAVKSNSMRSLVGSFMAAQAESTIEAVDRANIWEKEQKQSLLNRKQEEIDKAQEEFLLNRGNLTVVLTPEGPKMIDPAEEKYKQRLQEIENTYNQSLKMVEDRRESVGNTTFGLNMAILFPGNLYTLGKLYAGGWKSARNINKVKVKATKEAVKKAKELAKSGDKSELTRLLNLVLQAEKTGFLGLSAEEKEMVELTKQHLLGKKGYALARALGEPLKEGNEELAQEFAGQFASAYNGAQIDDYFSSSLDPNALKKTIDVMTAIGKAWDASYGDFNLWELFMVGAVTGLLGAPTVGRKSNNTDQTWLGKGKLFGISGGAYTQYRDAINEREREAEILVHANEAIKGELLAQNLRHFILQTSYDDEKKAAVFHDDKYEYENAQTKAIFSDIMWLAKTGRTDLLDNAVASMETWSDEDIEDLHKMTTDWVSGQNLFMPERRRAKEDAESKIDGVRQQVEELKQLLDQIPEDLRNSESYQSALQQLQLLQAELARLESIIEDGDAQVRNKNIMEVSPFVKPDGSVMSVEEIRQDINKRVQRFGELRQAVLDILSEIDLATNEAFTDELLDTLTWYKAMMWDWQNRAGLIASNIFGIINNISQEKIEQSISLLDETISKLDNLEDPSAAAVFNERRVALGGLLLSQVAFLRGLKTIKSILMKAGNGSLSRAAIGIKLADLLNSTDKVLIANKEDKTTETTSEKSKADEVEGEDIDLGLEEEKKEESKTPKKSDSKELGTAVFEILKGLIEATSTETNGTDAKVQTALKELEDLKKIGVAYNQYNSKLREYWKEPQKIEEEHTSFLNKITKAAKTSVEKVKNRKFDYDRPTNEIAAELWEKRKEIKEHPELVLKEYPKEAEDKLKEAFEYINHAYALESYLQGEDTLLQLKEGKGALWLSNTLVSYIKKGADITNFNIILESSGLIIEDNLYLDIVEKEAPILEEDKQKLNALNTSLQDSLSAFLLEYKRGKETDTDNNGPSDEITLITPTKIKVPDYSELRDGEVISGEPTVFPSIVGNIYVRTVIAKTDRGIAIFLSYNKDPEGREGYTDEEKSNIENYLIAIHPVLDLGINLENLKLPKEYLNSHQDVKIEGLTLAATVDDASNFTVLVSYKDASGKLQADMLSEGITLGAPETVDIATEETELEAADQALENKTQDSTNSNSVRPVSGDEPYYWRRYISQMWLNKRKRLDGKKYSAALENGDTQYPPFVKNEDRPKYLKRVKLIEEILDTEKAHAKLKELKINEKLTFITAQKFYENKKLKVAEDKKDDYSKIVLILNARGEVVGSSPDIALWEEQTQETLDLYNQIKNETFDSQLSLISRILEIADKKQRHAITQYLILDGTIQNAFVDNLYGGSINASTTFSPIMDLMENGKVPIITVAKLNRVGKVILSGYESYGISERDIIMPKLIKPGRVYALMPSCTGKYVACVCSTKKIRGEVPKDSLYMKSILSTFVDIFRNVNSATRVGALKVKLCKLIGISQDSLYIGKTNAGSIYIRAQVPSLKGDEEGGFTVFETHFAATATEDDIYNRFFSTGSKVPFGLNLRSWVNDSLLNETTPDGMLSDEALEYRKMVAEFLEVPIEKSTGWKTVNDFFTFQFVPIEAQTDNLPDPPVSPAESKTSDEPIIPNTSPSKAPSTQLAAANTDDEDENLAGEGASQTPVNPEDSPFLLQNEENKLERVATVSQRQLSLHLLRRLLPQVGQHGIKLVNGLIEAVDNYNNPVKAYGRFVNSMIEVSNISPVATEWHEAFHFVSDMLLTQAEKQRMYAAAAEKYGNLSNMELEEKVAEDFRLFMKSKLDTSFLGKLRNLFKSLKSTIKYLLGNRNYLDSLFYSIYKGKLSEREVNKNKISVQLQTDSFKEARRQMLKEKYKYSKLEKSYIKRLDSLGIDEMTYNKLTPEIQESLFKCE